MNISKQLWTIFAMVVLCATFAAPALSQGGGHDDPCFLDVSVDDVTCSATSNCENSSDCKVVKFTAPCTQAYSLEAIMTCTGPGTTCVSCQACATVIDAGGGNPAGTHTNCQNPCTQTISVNLTAGHSYDLYVCLKPCGEGSCNSCPASCYATARIHN